MEAMIINKPSRTGHLLTPSQGFLKKSWIKRFYALYDASDHGIQRIEVFENEENFHRQVSHKIIPLTDCVKVMANPQKHQSNVFEVVTKSQTYLFSAESFQDMTDWLISIRSAAFNLNSKPIPSQLMINQVDLSSRTSIQNEENMIYCSVDAPEVYTVRVCDSEVKATWKLNSTYNLVISSVGISLVDTGSGKGGTVLSWSYRHIRRYGYSHDTFSFEAGRKSSSGEGTFALETKDGSAIFQSIASHVSSLKSVLVTDSDVQSPSPTSGEGKSFFMSNSSSSPKQNSLESALRKEGSYAAIKPKQIAKPPRKSRIPADIPHLYEEPGEIKPSDTLYDLPTLRQEAWRTLGRDVDDQYHQEMLDDSCDPGYEDLRSFELKKNISEKYKGGSASLPKINNPLRKISEDRNFHSKLNLKKQDVSLPPRPGSLDSHYSKVEKILHRPESPSYANVLVESQTPDHFVMNDDEYAQIIRKKT